MCTEEEVTHGSWVQELVEYLYFGTTVFQDISKL